MMTLTAPSAFVFEARIPRTIFGFGTIKDVRNEVHRLQATRVLIVTENTARQHALAKTITDFLGDKAVGMWVSRKSSLEC